MVSDRYAIASIPVASEKEPPPEPIGVDPCKTPFAHAVMPPAMLDEKEPTSVDLLLDDRVERLLRENYLLLKERTELREIAQVRAEACNERLVQIREAKRLTRAMFAADERLADGDLGALSTDEAKALAVWAAKPI